MNLEIAKKLVKDEMNWFIKKTQEFVSYKSYAQKDDSPYPFGKDVQDALVFIVNEFKKLGIKTYLDHGGYYGYAEVGESKELFGILGHIDVVPISDLKKWIIDDPFKAQVVDQIFYGRGVADDKGPIIANLIALKILLNSGYKFKKRIRFIFGTDEESLWRGMAKYLTYEEKPNFAYVADASFPIVYAEKGLVNYYLTINFATDLNLEAGQAFNAVIGEAIYQGKNQELIMQNLTKLGFEFKKSGQKVIVKGKAAHAKDPNQGINAGVRLLIAIAKSNIKHPIIDFLVNQIGEDGHAHNIFGNLHDEPTGKITCNVGKIKITNKEASIALDIRYPVVDCDENKVYQLLVKSIKPYNLKIERYDALQPVYLPQNHPLIKLLHATYVEVSNDKSTKLLTTGGATYARAMPNCVSFGPIMPNINSNEHGPNEHWKLSEVEMAIVIYLKALIKINETDLK